LYFNKLHLPIQNTLIRATSDNDLVTNLVNTIENWITTRCNLLDNILIAQANLFLDNFQPPFRADDEILGFSTPSARRHYYKSSLLFSTQKIHELNIMIRADYFNDMMLRKHDGIRWTEHLYMPADISIDDYSMDNAGFRVRANYNILYPKDNRCG